MNAKYWTLQANNFLAWTRKNLDNPKAVRCLQAYHNMTVDAIRSIGCGYNVADILGMTYRSWGGDNDRTAYISCGITIPVTRRDSIVGIHVVRTVTPTVSWVSAVPLGSDIAAIIHGSGRSVCLCHSTRDALLAWYLSGGTLTCIGGGRIDDDAAAIVRQADICIAAPVDDAERAAWAVLRDDIACVSTGEIAKQASPADWWQYMAYRPLHRQPTAECHRCRRYRIPAGAQIGICDATHRCQTPNHRCDNPMQYQGA